MRVNRIGQAFVPAVLDGALQSIALEAGRIKVDGEGRTSLAGVWAGGDCAAGGEDLTVVAVEDGKIAAESINRALIVRAEWAARQLRLLGRADAQELGVTFVAAVQGIILMANAMHDAQVLARQIARVKDWVAQL